MRYYSDVTKSFYESEKACKEAEKKVEDAKREKEAKEKKLSEERAARAKEVEAAYAASVEASNKYYDLINKFTKDYGSFHMTISGSDDTVDSFDDLRSLARSLFKFF